MERQPTELHVDMGVRPYTMTIAAEGVDGPWYLHTERTRS